MPITVIEDVFDTALINHCTHYSRKILQEKHRMLFTSFAWPHEVVHDSPPVLVHPVPKSHELHGKITRAIEEKTGHTPTPESILFYYWPTHSYIPWHTDVHMKAGITVHLNERWDRDSGGLFLYEDEGIIKGIIPKRNLCVMQEGGVPHCTTPVLPRGKLRCTLQIWIH